MCTLHVPEGIRGNTLSCKQPNKEEVPQIASHSKKNILPHHHHKNSKVLYMHTLITPACNRTSTKKQEDFFLLLESSGVLESFSFQTALQGHGLAADLAAPAAPRPTPGRRLFAPPQRRPRSAPKNRCQTKWSDVQACPPPISLNPSRRKSYSSNAPDSSGSAARRVSCLGHRSQATQRLRSRSSWQLHAAPRPSGAANTPPERLLSMHFSKANTFSKTQAWGWLRIYIVSLEICPEGVAWALANKAAVAPGRQSNSQMHPQSLAAKHLVKLDWDSKIVPLFPGRIHGTQLLTLPSTPSAQSLYAFHLGIVRLFPHCTGDRGEEQRKGTGIHLKRPSTWGRRFFDLFLLRFF